MTEGIDGASLLKRFALLFLISSAVFFALLYTAIRFEDRLRLQEITVDEGKRIQMAAERVTRDIRGVDTELRFLANLPQFRRYLDSGDPALKEDLDDIFLALSRETGRYDQIRYIDADGREVIRVNYNRGRPAVESAGNLQDKSHRYYFTSTVGLDRGKVYVSPLDLNIEHKEIEIPYKPMIRYGTPVFDSKGENRGVLILNYFGEELLSDFRKVMQGGRVHRSMLLNRDGYWLSSDRHEDEWGFMFGRNDLTFAHAYPGSWKTIAAGEHGSFQADGGLFSYSTIYPLHRNGLSRGSEAAGSYSWKAISFVPGSTLEAGAFYNQSENRFLLIGSYILLVLACLFVAVIATSREGARKVVQDSAIRTRTILDHVADGIVTIDERGIIDTFNPAAEKLFGYRKDEVVGRSVSMLMPEPDRSKHPGYMAHYRDTGEAHVIGRERETLACHKNGDTFSIELGITEMMLGGERYFTGIARNVTARRQAETLLQEAKEKAEQANRAKDAFLATMSHEIRTPLTGMLGMLEMLSLTRLDEIQNQALQAAWSSGRNLLRIVNDILDWSKIEEGKLELSAHATSIPELLQEVAATYSHPASSKGILLLQQSDPRLSPAHRVDALRLSQILNNFVSNAIKFTQQGEVELRAELLERDGDRERIRLSVRDTGSGIAEDAQTRLFNRYEQESVDTERMYGGTGLGLSICRHLVEMMGGEIQLQSSPGHGSTFAITLSLPVADQPEERVQLQRPAEAQRRITPLFEAGDDAPRVLVVDDHPLNRMLLVRQLELLGLQAESAENGVDALPLWQEGRFRLVITDCHMPEMDGYALTREIRSREKGDGHAYTPVIAWTANALPDEERQCRSAGMDDLLLKPTSLKQLKEMLVKTLSLPEAENVDVAPEAPERKEGYLSSGPIDLSELEKMVPDRAGQKPVLQDFLFHMRAEYDQLSASFEQSEYSRTRNLAHRMKGASLAVGATQLVQSCSSLEDSLRQGDHREARIIVTTINDEIDAVAKLLAESDDQGRGTWIVQN